jgi:hypothetical protein
LTTILKGNINFKLNAMKTITLLLIGVNFFFNNSFTEPKISDIKALKVIEKRTEYNGIYYHYEINNVGNTTIQSKSYKAYLKVNEKTISFDKATSELKPGQTLKYKSQKTFYKKDNDFLNYVLEIKMDDSNQENNIIIGKSKL